MSSPRGVPAINVVGSALCAMAAVALCALSARSGWDFTSTYGLGNGNGILAALVLGALVVSLLVALLVLLALRWLRAPVRRRGVVLAVSALVTLGSMFPFAASGAAAHERGVRAEALACRADVVRDVLVLARAGGRVVPGNGSDTAGRPDGRCVAVVAVPGDAAAAMRTLNGTARGLGWGAPSARTWRSPAGVVVTAETKPHADSTGETVVDLGGRGQ